MATIQLEIEGEGAAAAAELLAIPGLEGHEEPPDEAARREGILATIATIIGITAGTLEIAEKIYQWYQKRRQGPTSDSVDKVLLIGRNGDRILLKNASIEQIQQILDR